MFKIMIIHNTFRILILFIQKICMNKFKFNKSNTECSSIRPTYIFSA